MQKCAKSTIALTLLLLCTGTSTHTSTARLIGGALFVGTGLTVLGQADELFLLDELGEKCNMSKEDINNVLSASILAYGIGCLPLDQETGKAIRTWAFRAPFIAALTGIVSSKTCNLVLSKIPGIGAYLGACSNTKCQGACNKCKVRTVLTTVTLWNYLVSRGVTYLETSRIGEYLL